MAETQPALSFEEIPEPEVDPIDAGTLVAEKDGVLVYRRRIEWVYADTGKRVSLKKPHYIGVCAECLIDSGTLTPDGIDAAVENAIYKCPIFCDRAEGDCPLEELEEARNANL